MAGGHYIFSLYKTSDENPQYFVLRTVLPTFRNSSQTEEAESWKAESAGRLKFLELIGKENNTERLELVGGVSRLSGRRYFLSGIGSIEYSGLLPGDRFRETLDYFRNFRLGRRICNDGRK